MVASNHAFSYRVSLSLTLSLSLSLSISLFSLETLKMSNQPPNRVNRISTKSKTKLKHNFYERNIFSIFPSVLPSHTRTHTLHTCGPKQLKKGSEYFVSAVPHWMCFILHFVRWRIALLSLYSINVCIARIHIPLLLLRGSTIGRISIAVWQRNKEFLFIQCNIFHLFCALGSSSCMDVEIRVVVLSHLP